MRTYRSILLGLCAAAGLARAEGPEGDLRVRAQGVAAAAEIGTSAAGDDLLLTLGGQTFGIRSMGERRWLLQWDALVALRGGYLANEHPFLPLAGGVVEGGAELGYRFTPNRWWSGYLGTRARASFQALGSPGLAASALNTINDTDGFGGFTTQGAFRVDGGASFLDARRSLLLVAFLQEAVRGAEVSSSGAAFFEGGLAARFDVASRWTLFAQAFWGRTPAVADAGLALTDQTTHEELDAAVRHTFRNHFWLAASASLSRETDHLVYAQSQTSYDTGSPSTFTFALLLGIPFGRQE